MLSSEIKKIFNSKIFRTIVCFALLLNILMISGHELSGTSKSDLTYSEYIRKIIDTAQYKLDEYIIMGYPETAFVCEYQQKVIDTYSRLENMQVQMYSSSDWQLLFSYNGSAVLLIVCAFLCGFTVFYSDRFNGSIYIVRTTRNGRFLTGSVKIIVSIISSFIITALFELSEIIYTVVTCGFGGIAEPLQSVPGMEMCPLSLSISQGLILRYSVHVLCFMAVQLLACFLTAVFNRYITMYLCGIAVLGSQYIIATFSFLNQYSFLNVVNIFKIYKLEFLKKFSAVRLFGYCMESEGVTIYTVLLFSIACIVSAVLCFGLRRYRQSGGNLSAILKYKKEQIGRKNFSLRINHVSVFKGEVYKLYAKPIVVIIAAAYIVLQLYTASGTYSENLTYTDNKYQEYMELLEGEPTEEKAEYIHTRLEYMYGTSGNEQNIHESYINGLISRDEYNKYQIEYYKCLDEIPVLERVAEQYYRCVSLREEGYDAILLYDTGWILYLTRSTDYMLIIVLILLIAGVFSVESENGILPIIRTTVNGRFLLLQKKYCSAVLGCIIGWFVSEIIPILYCCTNYSLPQKNASIYSLNYNLGNADLSIIQYVMLTLFLHLGGSIMLGMLMTSLSLSLKKTYAVIPAGVIIYLIRPTLKYFGVSLTFTPNVFFNSGNFYLAAYLLWIAVTVIICSVSSWIYCNKRFV